MAEGDYEYEKMRCELLGLPAPEKQPDMPREEKDDEEESADDVDGAALELGAERLDTNQDLEIGNEHMKNVSGGLDDLNSILSVTQKKLNKFKVVCGSLTNLLKIKVGTSKVDEASSSNDGSQIATDAEQDTGNSQVAGGAVKVTKVPKSGQNQQQRDISEMIDNQNDHLDAMLMKSERALLSMNSQRKQMKQFLAK